MPAIHCKGRDGVVRVFDYTITHRLLANAFEVRVSSRPLPSNGATFELSLCEIDESTLRVDMAHHHRQPEYVAMGIPEALLRALKVDLKKSIVSSPRQGHPGVYRTESATKYWERLRSDGGADYDPHADTYSVT